MFYSGDSSLGTCNACGSPVHDGGQSGAYCSNNDCPNGWGGARTSRVSCGRMNNPILYLSHTGGKPDDWWIVEPRDNPVQQVESLLRVGRRVFKLNLVRKEIVELSR